MMEELDAVALEDVAPGDRRPTPRPALTCRRMTDGDLDDAVALLCAGFPGRSFRYWLDGLERLRARKSPAGYPQYGYVLADGDRLVGIVLVIFAADDNGRIRGNVSSWYVEPRYRGYSNMLLAAPLKRKDVTLVNISPAPTTIETIKAQGFARYVSGTFIAFAGFAPHVFGARVRPVTATSQTESRILRDHAAWGCLCYEVAYRDELHPFVFVMRRIAKGRARGAQLIYCRTVDDFVRFAGPLGRRLMKRGIGAVLVDANSPLRSLPGLFRPDHSQKFSRGPATPRLGDLSYTELAIFGS